MWTLIGNIPSQPAKAEKLKALTLHLWIAMDLCTLKIKFAFYDKIFKKSSDSNTEGLWGAILDFQKHSPASNTFTGTKILPTSNNITIVAWFIKNQKTSEKIFCTSQPFEFQIRRWGLVGTDFIVSYPINMQEYDSITNFIDRFTKRGYFLPYKL